MNIIITGVFEALNLVSEKPNHYRVLSIVSEKSITQMMANDFGDVKEKLMLEFDDATPESRGYKTASRSQCEQALAFLKKSTDDCIVHCHAGVSRSTAIVLGYFLTLFEYKNAIDLLFELRPSAEPNKYVLELICQIINKEDLFPLVMEYIPQSRKK